MQPSYNAGARNGPAAIIAASQHVDEFDEELERECYHCGIATLDPLEINAAGPEAMHEDIFRAARRLHRDGKFPLALGGDHSISSALVRGAMTKHRKLSVLQVDAHCDLRDQFQGTPYSHASVMRRILDLGASVVPVGIRCVAGEEHRFMKRAGIRPVMARDCHLEDDWIDRVLGALGETVYVTIDVDGFDPAYAPGTGTPEPGGLDWYQVTALLRLVAAEKRIVAADIVEVMPLPNQVVTDFLAARLAYKLIGYVHADT
jgi:agmatinase